MSPEFADALIEAFETMLPQLEEINAYLDRELEVSDASVA